MWSSPRGKSAKGKTEYTALAVIEWFRLRLNRVLEWPSQSSELNQTNFELFGKEEKENILVSIRRAGRDIPPKDLQLQLH